MLKKNWRVDGYGAKSMNRLKFELPKLLNSGSKLQYLVHVFRLRPLNVNRSVRAFARAARLAGASYVTDSSRSFTKDPYSMYCRMSLFDHRPYRYSPRLCVASGD